jgi:protein-S-isoprenylcysteine O-methyltransferase Ste14
VVDVLERKVPRFTVFHRVAYNFFSLLTLIPLLIYSAIDVGDVAFRWGGGWNILRGLLFLCSMTLFYGGAQKYDLKSFVGLRQVREGQSRLLLSTDQQFSATGVFALTRHPWYLGSLLFIWSILPIYYEKSFSAGIILSVYLVTGTLLEERKILRQYGESYSQYQKKVSMLFPWRWLAARFFP